MSGNASATRRAETGDPRGGVSSRGTKSPPRRDKAANWVRRIPLLPALIFVIVATQVPMVITLVVSFFNWNSLYPDDIYFTGFDNYVSVFTSDRLRDAVWASIELTVVVVLVSLFLGMVFAVLLDRHFWGRGFVRTIFIAPFLIVPVASALVWKHALYNPEYGFFNGVLNWVWGIFGAEAPQPNWISEYPMMSVEAAMIWHWTPFMMLILLAGLQSRPLDVIEAARIDGASSWQVFRFMTLPHMRRYIELAALLGGIYIIQAFDAVFTITSGSLGTAHLPYVIYQEFFQAHDYGTASAAGVLVVIGSIGIAIFALRTVSTLLKEDRR